MRNRDLVTNFIKGEEEGKGSNLVVDNNSLVNYATVIAFRCKDKILLNGQHYSSTTSKHQNQLRREANVLEVPNEKLFNDIVKVLYDYDEYSDTIYYQLEEIQEEEDKELKALLTNDLKVMLENIFKGGSDNE